jgi:hypothetical protein
MGELGTGGMLENRNTSAATAVWRHESIIQRANEVSPDLAPGRGFLFRYKFKSGLAPSYRYLICGFSEQHREGPRVWPELLQLTLMEYRNAHP